MRIYRPCSQSLPPGGRWHAIACRKESASFFFLPINFRILPQSPSAPAPSRREPFFISLFESLLFANKKREEPLRWSNSSLLVTRTGFATAQRAYTPTSAKTVHRTVFFRFAPSCSNPCFLQTKKREEPLRWSNSSLLVTRTGFEPVLPP